MAATSLLANSRWNLIAFVFTLGAHFIIVPGVIAAIGLVPFGHAGLVIAVWAPLILVGTVIGQAVTRELAAQLATGAKQPWASQLASSALWLCAATSLLVGATFVWLGPYWLDWLDQQPRDLAGARADILALSIGWLAQQGLLVIQGIVAAHQDFKTIARISAASAIAAVISTLGMVQIFPDARGYLGGISLGFVIAALCAAWLVTGQGRLSNVSGRPSIAACRILLNFGKWQAVAQLSGTLGNQIDRYILASIASPAIIGQYNAANRLQEAAYSGVIKVAEVLFPRFGAGSHDSAEHRLTLLLTSSWAVMTFSCLVLAPMIISADPLLRLWAGPDVAQGGSHILQVLVLGGLIGCGSNVLTYYLMGAGDTAPLAAISVIYSLLTILFSLVLLNVYGPRAAGAGIALASLLRVFLALIIGKTRLFPQARWNHLLISTALPIAVAIAIALPVAWWGQLEFVDQWWELLVTIIGSIVAIGAAIVAMTSLSSFGRSLIGSLFSRVYNSPDTSTT
ncbi:MAG: oligosaccharide flippase family protein [Rubrivivax sp.]|jgi:O-antigen/teichoic acid export membrane protein